MNRWVVTHFPRFLSRRQKMVWAAYAIAQKNPGWTAPEYMTQRQWKRRSMVRDIFAFLNVHRALLTAAPKRMKGRMVFKWWRQHRPRA